MRAGSEERTIGVSGRATTRRRSLVFTDLSEVMPEVRRLAAGHRKLRNWTLAQVCRHLADTLFASIDGFDLRRHRFKRWFLCKPLLIYTYRFGIPRGYTVDPKLTPPREVELAAALSDLTEALARYRTHAGPLHPHPLFGRLRRKAWDRLHCFHCAHHLSFLIPEAVPPTTHRQGLGVLPGSSDSRA
jgi:hypothetical protein